ncbi:MAG: hypothetical protein JTT11_10675 [Candidatus Brockarchaeota archaeon]|nr:hypothetical protein [Candidatus Brockarchaeota archaeon]
MEGAGVEEGKGREGTLSIVMLAATAIFAIAVISMPGKLTPRPDAQVNGAQGRGSYWLPGVGEVPYYALPLDKEVVMPISSSFVFRVSLVSGQAVEGKLEERGGSCFSFYVLDEAAYLLYAKGGPGSLSKAEGVYASAAPAHSRAGFKFVPDRTGDFYFVLISPPGSCRGKIVDIELRS